MNSQTGKIVHSIDCSSYSKANICCLGWGLNFTSIKKDIGLNDVLSCDNQTQGSDIPLDLPTDLAFLDVEDILPKLSVLPSSGKEWVIS